MNSLNSIQYDREQQTLKNNVETVSIEKPTQQPDMDASSIVLLTNKKKIESGSPNMFGSTNSKAFANLFKFIHIAEFAKKFQRCLKPDSRFSDRHFGLINDRASGQFKDFLSFFNQKSRKATPFSMANFDELEPSVKIRYKFRKLKNSFLSKVYILFESLPLLDPEFKLKMCWDILISLLRVYLMFTIPFILAFEHLETTLDDYLFLSSWALIIDLLLRFITIYYDQGMPVQERYIILKNQYQQMTLYEIGGIFILLFYATQDFDFKSEFVLNKGWPKFLLLLYFTQIQNLLQFINSRQSILSLGKVVSSFIELGKLIGLILLIQHLCSCIWIVIGKYGESRNRDNWISANQLQDCSEFELYLDSLYYISVTMFTVGYGDIHPQNSTEKVFSLFYMFLCSLQLSYSVNTIGNILTQISKTNEIIKKKFTSINQYMNDKKISPSLQVQVREYLNYYWYQEQIQQTKEQTEILNQLSEELRRAIAMESNGHVLKNCPFFDGYSKEFTQELLKHLKFTTYQPQTIITTESQEFDFSINIIASGEVNVLESREGNQVAIGSLQIGQTIGVDQFLSNQRNERIVYKSARFVSVLVIPKSHFMKVIGKFPQDKELFWSQQLTHRQRYCAACDSQRHQTEHCRQFHYVPEQEKVLKRYIFNQRQERMFFIRNRNRHKHYFHAHANQKELHEAADLVRMGNDSDVFQKWMHTVEDSTGNESNSGLKVRMASDSLSVMIREFESKQELLMKTEKEIKQKKSTQEHSYIRLLQEKLKYQQFYSPHDVEQIEFTLRKLLLDVQEKEDSINIDRYKEYQSYQPQQNINHLIKRNLCGARKFNYQTSKSFEPIQLSTLSHWLKYLAFPFEFFQQYKTRNRAGSPMIRQSQVRQQQQELSLKLIKKRGHKRYIRRTLQVFPAE